MPEAEYMGPGEPVQHGAQSSNYREQHGGEGLAGLAQDPRIQNQEGQDEDCRGQQDQTVQAHCAVNNSEDDVGEPFVSGPGRAVHSMGIGIGARDYKGLENVLACNDVPAGVSVIEERAADRENSNKETEEYGIAYGRHEPLDRA